MAVQSLREKQQMGPSEVGDLRSLAQSFRGFLSRFFASTELHARKMGVKIDFLVKQVKVD